MWINASGKLIQTKTNEPRFKEAIQVRWDSWVDVSKILEEILSQSWGLVGANDEQNYTTLHPGGITTSNRKSEYKATRVERIEQLIDE